jgi:tetratricopeptide (TPR) repeat protein
MSRGLAIGRHLLAFLAVACLVCSAAAAVDSLAEYQAAKQKALAPLQADYDRIVAAHGDDPVVRKYQERLERLDEVAARVIEGLSACQRAAQQDVVGDVVDPLPADARKPSIGNPATDGTGDAIQMLAEYDACFAEGLPVPGFFRKNRAPLAAYLTEATGFAIKAIQAKGGTLFATTTDRPTVDRICQLCVVLPLLQVRDADWSAKQIGSLPEWLREPGCLLAVESLCLHAGRPLSAYQTFLWRNAPAGAGTAGAEYMLMSGKKMREERDLAAAACCFRTGLSLAGQAGDPALQAQLHIGLAEALYETGRPMEAAEELKGIRGASPVQQFHCDAVVLRLKYLFSGGEFPRVLAEAPALIQDKGYETVWPEASFILWLALLRSGKPQEAAEMAGRFLASYRDHPLAADVLYVSAVSATRDGDYTKADELLAALIEQFPDYRSILRARFIRGRISHARALGFVGR